MQLTSVITLERRLFLQFFVGILLAINNGACFCFGIFSPYMKMGAFHYSQSEINLVSTIGVLISYFSIPTGFLYDYKGPKATILAATVLNVVGWAGLFLIFINMEHPLLSTNVAVMSIFYALSQFSSSYYESGTILTNLKMFSCYQGRVVLVQKTFMGLGSSIIAQMYVAFFVKYSSIGPFFLFLMSYAIVVGVLGVYFMQLPTPETQCLGLNVMDKETLAKGGGEPKLFKRPFLIGTTILCISVIFILAASLAENNIELSNVGRVMIGVVNILLVLSFTLIIFFTPSYSENVGGYSSHEEEMNASGVVKIINERATKSINDNYNSCEKRRLSTDIIIEECRSEDHDYTINKAANTNIGEEENKLTENKKIMPSKVEKFEDDNRQSENLSNNELNNCRGENANSLENELSNKICASSVNLENGNRNNEESCRYVRETDACSGSEHQLQRVNEQNILYTEDIVPSPVATEKQIQSPVLTMSEQRVILNENSLWKNLCHREIWLLWFVCFGAWSAMTLIQSNSSQIYQSISFDNFSLTVNSVFVSVFGVASALGRVIVGLAHPILQRRGIFITCFLFIAPILNVFGLLFFLFVPVSVLFLPFCLVGLATGVSWGSTVLIITTFFINHNCGKHYSWLYTAGMLSPIVFNTGLFGPIYDHYSRVQGRTVDKTCKGVICIWIPLVVCAIINFFAIFAAIAFMRRTSLRNGVVIENVDDVNNMVEVIY